MSKFDFPCFRGQCLDNSALSTLRMSDWFRRSSVSCKVLHGRLSSFCSTESLVRNCSWRRSTVWSWLWLQRVHPSCERGKYVGVAGKECSVNIWGCFYLWWHEQWSLGSSCWKYHASDAWRRSQVCGFSFPRYHLWTWRPFLVYRWLCNLSLWVFQMELSFGGLLCVGFHRFKLLLIQLLHLPICYHLYSILLTVEIS